MQILTKPRLDGISKLLDWDYKVADLGLLSLKDVMFLRVIECIDSMTYSNRIKTQLNYIRDGYIRYMRNGCQYDIILSLYDSTKLFRIAIICENQADYNEYITRKFHHLFSLDRIRSNCHSVESIFELIQISNVDITRGLEVDGYVETKRARNNKHYSEIKSILRTCMNQ